MNRRNGESDGRRDMKTTTRRRGFTLIELLVVIAIIGVLFAVALPVFENAGRKDTDRAAFNLMNTLRLARQNAIAKRQWTVVVFPTNEDSPAYAATDLKKCLRGYAVLAATNNLDGQNRADWGSNLRDPPADFMEFTYVSDWKYLPEGIYFDDDPDLPGNYVFGAKNGTQSTYTGAFQFPIVPGAAGTRPMGAVMFKPNGRAYVMHDSNVDGKYWQDADRSKIYLTSALYYEESVGGLTGPTTIPGTSTVVMVRNKTGQMQITAP